LKQGLPQHKNDVKIKKSTKYKKRLGCIASESFHFLKNDVLLTTCSFFSFFHNKILKKTTKCEIIDKAGKIPSLGEVAFLKFHQGVLAMKGICFECGTPLISEKCYFCGKIKKKSFTEEETRPLSEEERFYQQCYDGIGVMSERWFKAITISGTIAALIIGVVFLLYHTIYTVSSARTPTQEYRYVCSPSQIYPDIMAVTIIETYGTTIVRWIEEQTFPRKYFIANYLLMTEDVPDEEIIAFFYLVYLLEEFMEGTYWELVSVDEEYVIAHHIYNYENMSRSDLDQLWEPSFSGVNLNTAITFLRSQGAMCVRE